MLPLVRLEV